MTTPTDGSATADPIRPAAPAEAAAPVVRPTRLPSLTGLRFVAALLVFAFHTLFALGFVTGPAAGPLGHLLFRGGGYGVGFFFVLSGFVLTWTHRPDRPATVFIRERLAKIVPNHLVTFVIAVVLAATAGTALGVSGWLPSMLLVQAWWPSFGVVTSANSVSWSLSCELLFYLCFPVIIRLVRKVRPERLWAAVGVVVALTVLVAVVAQWVIPDQPRLPYSGFTSISFAQMWFVYYFPPTRMLDFLLGIFVARLVLSGRWPRLGFLPAIAVAVAGYAIVSVSPYLFGAGGLGSIWVAPLIAAGARADLRVTFSPVRSAVWVWLGDISFAFYMVHAILLTEVRTALGAAWNAPLVAELMVVVGCLLVSVGLAWTLHVLVERPVMNRVHALRRPRRPELRPG
jgi:peptidoglycan/LPS O-acetylase OafA/YrhL